MCVYNGLSDGICFDCDVKGFSPLLAVTEPLQQRNSNNDTEQAVVILNEGAAIPDDGEISDDGSEEGAAESPKDAHADEQSNNAVVSTVLCDNSGDNSDKEGAKKKKSNKKGKKGGSKKRKVGTESSQVAQVEIISTVVHATELPKIAGENSDNEDSSNANNNNNNKKGKKVVSRNNKKATESSRVMEIGSVGGGGYDSFSDIDADSGVDSDAEPVQTHGTEAQPEQVQTTAVDADTVQSASEEFISSLVVNELPYDQEMINRTPMAEVLCGLVPAHRKLRYKMPNDELKVAKVSVYLPDNCDIMLLWGYDGDAKLCEAFSNQDFELLKRYG